MLPMSRAVTIALLLSACTNAMNEIDAGVRAELIPNGELRVAVPVGPAVSATFATRDAVTGMPWGPTVVLGAALADRLGVPVRYIEYSSSGEVATAGSDNQWDVTFVPVDAARAEVVDFGPAYSLFDSTFMVRSGLDCTTVAELDQPGRKIGAVDNTTTGRAAARTLRHAELSMHASVDELRDLLISGGIDAVALSRLSLASLLPAAPGAKILDEAFHSTATAIAVPKGHAAALRYVAAFIEEAKASGLAREALDSTGLAAARVAPPIEE